MVAVTLDRVVWEYKNKRPVIPFEERVEIIAAVRYVDIVVPQPNRDKIRAWEKFGFDALFVGDDWKGDPLYEKTEEKFKKHGIDVVYFSYTEGISSTKLTKRLDDMNARNILERKLMDPVG